MATRPGQDVVLAGSHPALGAWSLDGAVRLSWTDGHVWCGSIDMPPNADFEYKVCACPASNTSLVSCCQPLHAALVGVWQPRAAREYASNHFRASRAHC
jgi:hypothetical protein